MLIFVLMVMMRVFEVLVVVLWRYFFVVCVLMLFCMVIGVLVGRWFVRVFWIMVVSGVFG